FHNRALPGLGQFDRVDDLATVAGFERGRAADHQEALDAGTAHRRNEVLGLTGNETGGADDRVVAFQYLGGGLGIREIAGYGAEPRLCRDFLRVARDARNAMATAQQFRCNLAADSAAGSDQCNSFTHAAAPVACSGLLLLALSN